MADKPSTLNHRARETTAPAIASYARDQARIAGDAADGSDYVLPRHVAALNSLADFVASKGPMDERIYTLSRIATFEGDEPSYKPGDQQKRLFGLLGQVGFTPLPEATLNELVAAAGDDLLAEKEDELGKMRHAVTRAETEHKSVSEMREQVESAEQRSADLSGELAAERSEVNSLREQVEHLQAMLGGVGGPQDAHPAEGEEAKEKPRRASVPGHVGIYQRQTDKKGLLYEVGWREDGKQKWLMVGPDLDEAVQTRKELTKKPEEVAA